MLAVIHGNIDTANYPRLSTVNCPPSQAAMARLKFRAMEDNENNGLKQRIEERLQTLKISPRAASLKAGGSADLIRGILRGNNRTLRGDHLVKVARVLGVSETWLQNGSEDIAESQDTDGTKGVPYGGIVEAGAFRRVDLLDQDGERTFIPIAPDPRFPSSAQHAWRVEGDSMTEAGIMPGMYVLAVDVLAFERINGEPGDGKLVIVAQSRNGDPEREVTVKRLRIFRDRVELQPESKNPRHQPIVYHWPRDDQETGEAAILAVVLQAVRVY